MYTDQQFEESLILSTEYITIVGRIVAGGFESEDTLVFKTAASSKSQKVPFISFFCKIRITYY